MSYKVKKMAKPRHINIYILKKRIRFAIEVIILLFFLALIILMSLRINSLSKDLEKKDKGIFMTDMEVSAGTRRFVDNFYSMNSATVSLDQYRAIAMIIDQGVRNNRIKYLQETDFVRKVKQAGIRSYIDWDKVTEEMDRKKDGEGYKVSYKGAFVISSKSSTAVPFHIILEVIPVPKSNKNPNGIGVISLVDIAEKPFAESEGKEVK